LWDRRTEHMSAAFAGVAKSAPRDKVVKHTENEAQLVPAK
jgi:hypothetical protein